MSRQMYRQRPKFRGFLLLNALTWATCLLVVTAAPAFRDQYSYHAFLGLCASQAHLLGFCAVFANASNDEWGPAVAIVAALAAMGCFIFPIAFILLAGGCSIAVFQLIRWRCELHLQLGEGAAGRFQFTLGAILAMFLSMGIVFAVGRAVGDWWSGLSLLMTFAVVGPAVVWSLLIPGSTLARLVFVAAGILPPVAVGFSLAVSEVQEIAQRLIGIFVHVASLLVIFGYLRALGYRLHRASRLKMPTGNPADQASIVNGERWT